MSLFYNIRIYVFYACVILNGGAEAKNLFNNGSGIVTENNKNTSECSPPLSPSFSLERLVVTEPNYDLSCRKNFSGPAFSKYFRIGPGIVMFSDKWGMVWRADVYKKTQDSSLSLPVFGRVICWGTVSRLSQRVSGPDEIDSLPTIDEIEHSAKLAGAVITPQELAEKLSNLNSQASVAKVEVEAPPTSPSPDEAAGSEPEFSEACNRVLRHSYQQAVVLSSILTISTRWGMIWRADVQSVPFHTAQISEDKVLRFKLMCWGQQKQPSQFIYSDFVRVTR